MLRIYTVYYFKVLQETKGQFWKETEAAIVGSSMNIQEKEGESNEDKVKK